MIGHLCTSFYPRSTGGTESYILHLAQKQCSEEQSVKIFCLDGRESWTYNKLEVESFKHPTYSKGEYYGGARVHQDLLKAIGKNNISKLYIHDRNPSFSAAFIRAVKSQNPEVECIGVYHSPGQSCPNRSLIQVSGNICDGKIESKRCTACRMGIKSNKGMGSFASVFSVDRAWGAKNPLAEWSHARYFTSLYKKAFQEWVHALDVVQYHAKWVKNLLILNDLSPEKLRYVSLQEIYDFKPAATTNKGQAIIDVVCSGRCTNIKGQHLLLDALEALPKVFQARIKVHFIGPGFDAPSDYAREICKRIAAAPYCLPPYLLAQEQVPSFLKDKHIGVVPSLWPETGPLVVLDFLQAGMPVLSSPYIGIEHHAIQHFAYGNAHSLAQNLQRLIGDYGKAA